MKRITLFYCMFVVIFLFATIASAQEETQDSTITEDTQEEPQDEGKLTVSDRWACTMLIDNQTCAMPYAQSFEMIIHHRFDKIEEISDLFGLYGPSNIRLGFNYGITDNIMVGIGTEKNNKMQELMWKWNVLNQNRSGKMPVTVTYFGNIVLDAGNEENFGGEYKFAHRFSYFNELLVSRKLTDKLSLQLGPNISHFNVVDSTMQNDIIGLTYGGRFKFYNEISFIVEGNYQITKPEINPPKQSIGFGFEIATSTHAFQIFASSFDHIEPQKNYVYNQNDLYDGGWKVGFNITVRF